MTVTYLLLLFTTLFLAGTWLHYRYTVKRGQEFRFKPFTLLIIVLLFLLAAYGSITGKPFNEIVPFIG